MLLRQIGPVGLITNHLIYYPTPVNLLYMWGVGSLAGLLLAWQIVTGIFLAMRYAAHTDIAFNGAELLTRNAAFGWFLRYLHANGASFFFCALYFHVGRNVYFSLYRYTRRHVWLSGLILFMLTMATAFLGYVLPWGQMSFWGATVITNLFSALPIIGESIAWWIWGGFSVTSVTLNRFFSFHYVLPFALVGVALAHLSILHVFGSSTPIGIAKTGDKVGFYPYFYVKDYFGFVAIGCLCGLILTMIPDWLGHPDNYVEANPLVTPTHIVPEWYFLPFYAILRSIPNKLGGVIAMGASIVILALLPYCFIKLRSNTSQMRYVYIFVFWFFCLIVCLLGILGGLPIEPPYTNIAQFLTVIYFSFFSVFVALDSLASRYCYIIRNQLTETYGWSKRFPIKLYWRWYKPYPRAIAIIEI